jgi:DNA polymerase III epsilon subunit-like protein
MKIIVFDTETTNKPPPVPVLSETIDFWPHIVQLSFILFDTETFHYKEYDYVIQCAVPIENDHIHGITTSMNKARGYTFTDILPIFELCMNQCELIIGHNIEFDMNMIRAECLRNDIPFEFTKPFYCTMKSTTRICKLPRMKWPTLKELHFHLFQEDAKNLHNSMIDVIVCLRCYLKLMQDIDICEKIKRLRVF